MFQKCSFWRKRSCFSTHFLSIVALYVPLSHIPVHFPPSIYASSFGKLFAVSPCSYILQDSKPTFLTMCSRNVFFLIISTIFIFILIFLKFMNWSSTVLLFRHVSFFCTSQMVKDMSLSRHIKFWWISWHQRISPVLCWDNSFAVPLIPNVTPSMLLLASVLNVFPL